MCTFLADEKVFHAHRPNVGLLKHNAQQIKHVNVKVLSNFFQKPTPTPFCTSPCSSLQIPSLKAQTHTHTRTHLLRWIRFRSSESRHVGSFLLLPQIYPPSPLLSNFPPLWGDFSPHKHDSRHTHTHPHTLTQTHSLFPAGIRCHLSRCNYAQGANSVSLTSLGSSQHTQKGVCLCVCVLCVWGR